MLKQCASTAQYVASRQLKRRRSRNTAEFKLLRKNRKKLRREAAKNNRSATDNLSRWKIKMIILTKLMQFFSTSSLRPPNKAVFTTSKESWTALDRHNYQTFLDKYLGEVSYILEMRIVFIFTRFVKALRNRTTLILLQTPKTQAVHQKFEQGAY